MTTEISYMQFVVQAGPKEIHELHQRDGIVFNRTTSHRFIPSANQQGPELVRNGKVFYHAVDLQVLADVLPQALDTGDWSRPVKSPCHYWLCRLPAFDPDDRPCYYPLPLLFSSEQEQIDAALRTGMARPDPDWVEIARLTVHSELMCIDSAT